MRELSKNKFEELTIVFVLFLFVGSLPWTFFLMDLDPDQEIPAQTRLTLRLLWILAYIPALTLFFLKCREVYLKALTNPLLLILVSLPLLSVIWSVSPVDTLRRGMGLFVTTLFGLFLGTRCSRTDLLHYLAWVLTSVMVLSWAWGLLMPDWGKMSYGDGLAWRGIFSHKNTMGEIMLLYVIVLIYLFQTNSRYRPYYILFMILGIILLYLSKSITPVLVGLVLVLAVVLFRVSPQRNSFVLPWFALSFLWVCFTLFLIFDNLDTVLGLFGRDSSLTGRDKVWQSLWEQIQSHFLLGFGYQAFWLDETGAVTLVWKSLKWKMFSAHNGYIEICLDLGIVGLLLFILVFSKSMVTAITLAMQESSWPFTFLSFFFLLNFAESRILEQNSLYWVLFVAISTQLLKTNSPMSTNPR